MRTRAMTSLCVLVCCGTSTQAAPSIDLFGANPSTELVDFGVCQGTVMPRGFPLQLFIYAHLGGLAPEMGGAAFFCRESGPNGEDRNNIFVPVSNGGLGWQAPAFENPAAAVTVGFPFVATGTPPNLVHQAAIAWSVDPVTGVDCQHGDADAPPGHVWLYAISIFKTTLGDPIPADTYLRVSAADPPVREGMECPILILCDTPAFTAVCVTGGEFIVNPSARNCTVAIETRSWGSIKTLYRDTVQ